MKKFKCIHEFILDVGKPFEEHINLAGFKIYLNEKFSGVEAARRIAPVLQIPMDYTGPISVGDLVLFDPSILYRPIYQGVRQDSMYLVDKSKQWYRIMPNLILLFKKDGGDWQGHLDNNLVEPIEEIVKEKQGSIYIPNLGSKSKEKTGIVRFINSQLSALGVEVGDRIVSKDYTESVFKLEGKTYWFMQNEHVLAKIV